MPACLRLPAGFTSEQRELLGPMLKRISSRLQEVGAVRKRPLIIFHARVPIIKVGCAAARQACTWLSVDAPN
jgi:hypothetical protein